MECDLSKLRIPEALRPFALAHASAPAPFRALAEMLLTMSGRVDAAELGLCALDLRRAAPGDALVWALTANILSPRIPNYHWAMVNDGLRNEAYAAAIAAAVRPGMTVLEIGTGAGLLAMLAARAGAAHVYTLERTPETAEIARRCIALNGLSERITVLTMDAKDARIGTHIPRRCDLVVHEIFASDLVGEGVIPVIAHARENLLVPGAPLVPERAWIKAALVDGSRHLPGMETSTVFGFDLSPLNDAGRARIFVSQPKSRDILAEPAEAAHVDLRKAIDRQRSSETLHFDIRQPGMANGVVQTLCFGFPDGSEFEAANPDSNWSRNFYPFRHRREVRVGEQVRIRLDQNEATLAFDLDDTPASPDAETDNQIPGTVTGTRSRLTPA